MFLNQGHKKDNDINAISAPENVSRSDIESVDQHILFISQKAEKITAALYLITDFIKDKEPFKWEIRDSAIVFFSFTNSLKGARIASQKEQAIEKALSQLSLILSLLRFGVSVRFLSHMNYSILKDEYTSLKETLEDRLKTRQPVDGLVLPQDFFQLKTKELSTQQYPNVPYGHDIENKNIGGKPSVVYSDVARAEKNDEKIVAEKNVDTSQSQPVFMDGAIESKKGMRQDVILKLLKTRGWISIKDISEIISECSEKTIQRELASLVDRGVIRKTGERRWSKYALN